MKKFATTIIGIFLSLKYQLTETNRSINIGEHLAKVQKILIYMPNENELFKAALDSLKILRIKVPASNLTLITQNDQVKLIRNLNKVDILSYSTSDINFFGLPKKSLLQFFKTSIYDLALDLNPGYDILSIVLFQRSKAPLKVCLDTKEKSPFYNFRIRTNAGQPMDKKYQAMIQYITVLQHSKITKKSVSSTW